MRGISKLFNRIGKKGRFALLLAPLLVALAVMVPMVAAEDMTVSGHVRDASNNQPIEGAHLRIYFSTFFSVEATTDENGFYSMAVPFVFSGYTLDVTPPPGSDYYSQSYNLGVSSSMTHDINLQPIVTYSQVTLSGNVRDFYHVMEFVGIENANVEVFTPGIGGTLVASDTTDAQGDYSMVLAPGSYVIKVTPPAGSGLETKEQDLNISNSSPTQSLGFNLYYITLPTATVTGTLTDTVTGEPIANANVEFVEKNIAFELNGETVASTTTDAQGNYSFTAAAPYACGCYNVNISMPTVGGRPASLEYHSNTFTDVWLGDEDRDYDYQLQPVPETAVLTLAIPQGVRAEVYNFTGQLVATHTEGTHALTLPADFYKIKPSIIGELPEHQYGGNEYFDFSTTPVNIDLRQNASWSPNLSPATKVSGQVTDTEGRPMKGSRVRIVFPPFPTAPIDWRGTTDENGYYEVKVLPLASVQSSFPNGYYEIQVNSCTSVHEYTVLGNQQIYTNSTRDIVVNATRTFGQVSLCGKVTNAFNQASAGRSVYAYEVGTTNLVGTATTDGYGEYGLNLDAGEYDITFTNESSTPQATIQMSNVDIAQDKLLNVILDDVPDTTAPQVAAFNLSENTIDEGEQATVTAVASDDLSGIDGGEYFIGTDPGQGNGTAMSWNGTQLSATFGDTLAAGTYDISVRAKDASGNWSTVLTGQLTVNDVDTSAPVISYELNPELPQSGWYKSPVTLVWTVTDAESDITQQTGCDEATVNADTDADGTSITCSATSLGGASEETVTIKYDGTAPTLGTEIWTANPVNAQTDTTLKVPATDVLSGVTGGEYFIGTDPGQGNGITMTLANGELSAAFGSALSAGTHTVSVRAKDVAGNWSQVKTVQLEMYAANTAQRSLYLVSKDAADPFNWPKTSVTISADGRYVLFIADDPLQGDFNPDTTHLYLRDRQTNTTTPVSVNGQGQWAKKVFTAHITSDNRYVVFNGVFPDSPYYNSGNPYNEVFKKDLQTGSLEMVSPRYTDNAWEGWVYPQGISADGRYVLFQSNSNAIMQGVGSPFGNQFHRLYVRDTVNNTYALASSSATNQPAGGHAWNGSMTDDGRYVVFTASASDLVPGNSLRNVFRKDLQTGEIQIVSKGPNNETGNSRSLSGLISPDGQAIVFSSEATNFGYPLVNNLSNLYFKDLTTGEFKKIASKVDFDNHSLVDPTRYSISGDKQWVVFPRLNQQSTYNAILWNRTTGQSEVAPGALSFDGINVMHNALSDNGQLAYSAANALLPEDTNPRADTYVYGFNVDSTPPTVTGVPDRAPNAQGWYNADVTIDWQSSDGSDPANTVASLTGENTYTSGQSCDPAGNCATGNLTLKIDKTAPQTFIMLDPLNGATVSGIYRFSFKIIDDVSGIKKIIANVGGVSYSWNEANQAASSIKKHATEPDTWYIDVNTNNLPDGVNHIVLRPTDRADNIRYWNNRKDQHHFVVDNVQ